MKLKRLPLAFLVSLEAALVTALAMGVYAIFQYQQSEHLDAWTLFLRHGWHVVVLGGLIYFGLIMILRKELIDPINKIYVKCYAITKGDYSPIRIDTKINEIHEIAEGINMMMAQLHGMDQDDSPGSPDREVSEESIIHSFEPGANYPS